MITRGSLMIDPWLLAKISSRVLELIRFWPKNGMCHTLQNTMRQQKCWISPLIHGSLIYGVIKSQMFTRNLCSVPHFLHYKYGVFTQKWVVNKNVVLWFIPFLFLSSLFSSYLILKLTNNNIYPQNHVLHIYKPLGGECGKSRDNNNFIRKSPLSYGVPAAR